jgi:hypothetical protein
VNNVVNESNLGLFDGGRSPVTHWTYVESLFPLHVSLSKEFLHDTVRPATVQVEWLRWVAQVRTMNKTFQHLNTFAVCIQTKNSTAGQFVRLDHCLEICDVVHVFVHVGRQHYFDDHATKRLTGLGRQTMKDVKSILLEQLEGNGKVMTF